MTPTTKVALLDLRRSGPELDRALEEAFRRVLRSGQYILGPEVEAFEKECAEYVGAKHSIAVSSGTDALLVALMALGIGPGDEVLCPTFTFFATAGVVSRLGARPVFVDSDLVTFNLDPEKLEGTISSKTKAIMPVHLFGQCADMSAIVRIAARHSIPVVEDAAQALGAEHEGRRAGTFGAFGCFSFFPSKNLGALGDAGLVTTNDGGLADAVRVLRVHGGNPKYHHAVVGGNFRIDALQAALLRVKLPHLDAASERRLHNARYYWGELASRGLTTVGANPSTAPIALPAVPAGHGRHVFNQFVIRLPGPGVRDRVRSHLSARGIGTEIYYPIPLHLQPCFASLGHELGDFPMAERLANESLALPIFPELAKNELDYVIAVLAEAVADGSP